MRISRADGGSSPRADTQGAGSRFDPLATLASQLLAAHWPTRADAVKVGRRAVRATTSAFPGRTLTVASTAASSALALGATVPLCSATVLEPPAFVAGLDDVAVMRQPVEESRRHLGVAEHVSPFGEGEVRRHDD